MRRIRQFIMFVVMCLPALAAADYQAGQSAYTAGNFSQAAELWLAAAKQGDANAMYELGKLYGEGLGVLQDFTRSHAFFNLAASKGHKQALQARSVVEGQMTTEERAQARKLASQYLKSWSSATAAQPPPPEPVVVVTNTAASQSRTLIVVPFVSVLPQSNNEIKKLARDWPKMTEELVTRSVGNAWRVVTAEDDYNLYSGRRKIKRARTLCKKHRGDQLLVVRLPAKPEHGEFGGTPESNWRRQLELVAFDCTSNEQTARNRLQIDSNNDGWPVQEPIRAFLRETRLAR